ncbi:hypothetical protein OIU77_026876 [Salix suchowensis]|uniref:Uncharacterized protein n=1 Tax=Salix suchowensis TaxID=1278906 RepID=A0ABQ9BQB1_9ROSI|nr:hypothetical protein OIU77_026876 [Salix suchowensis]
MFQISENDDAEDAILTQNLEETRVCEEKQGQD